MVLLPRRPDKIVASTRVVGTLRNSCQTPGDGGRQPVVSASEAVGRREVGVSKRLRLNLSLRTRLETWDRREVGHWVSKRLRLNVSLRTRLKRDRRTEGGREQQRIVVRVVLKQPGIKHQERSLLTHNPCPATIVTRPSSGASLLSILSRCGWATMTPPLQCNWSLRKRIRCNFLRPSRLAGIISDDNQTGSSWSARRHKELGLAAD